MNSKFKGEAHDHHHQGKGALERTHRGDAQEGRRRAAAQRSPGPHRERPETGRLREKSNSLDRRIEEVAKALDAVAKEAGYFDSQPYRYRFEHSTHIWDHAVATRQTMLDSELLAKHPVGARVLRLRIEQGSLLDTIGLSISPTQIRELWKNVVALVNEKLPTLQQQVFTTPPSPAEDA